MSNRIEIKGNESFVEKCTKGLEDFGDIIEVFQSDENNIVIYGDVAPKVVLLTGGLLGQEVFWNINGEPIDIYDVEMLLREQDVAFKNSDWKLVKLINKIIMEVELYQKKSDVHFYPTKIQVEHSTICNAKCIMCTHYFTNNYKRSFIDDKAIESIIPILPYIDKILLHGVGEAFLHPNIEKYLKLYAEYGVEVSCVTNMTRMSPGLAEEIGKTFKSITISCDGASKETFEGIRRGVSFESFCDNIRLLHKLQPSLELRFNVVCMRQNIVEMPRIIELAAELGVSAVGISGLIAQKVLDNLEDEIRFYPKVATHYLKEAISRADELGIKMLQFPEYVFSLESDNTFEQELNIINQKPFYHTEEFQEELYQRYRKMDVVKPTEQANLSSYAQKSLYGCEGICDYIVESPFVGVTGEVTTCCIDGIHIMGDLKQNSFTEIWNNEVYRRMREMFFEGCLPKYCVGCMFLKDHTNVKRIELTNVDADFFEHKFSDLLDTSDSED